MTTGVDLERELTATIARFRHDPLGFVQFAFPWGVAGSPLEGFASPQSWQALELIAIGQALGGGTRKQRRAVASGKGIGKSALISMVVLWALCTFEDTKVVLTAGTEPQLRTKTMPEVAKWFRMLICKHWFKFTATSIYVNDPDPEAQKAWRLDALPWNASNPEAFQGLHNQGKRLVVLFDEASQIADEIFNATEGIFSDADTEVLWICYGNPTRGIGKFKEAFDAGSRWRTKNIDSREVAITDKDELAAQVKELGEDHDVIRWSVRGLFPRAASTQFIGSDIVQQARKNDATALLQDPLILGVDVARFGGDKSVICPRKGRDARSIPWKIMHGHDTMQVANAVAEMYRLYKADAVHVDGGGVGAGVVDRLREMAVPVVDVQFGAKSDAAMLDVNADRYANKRSEIWGTMKKMLPVIAIPDEQDLERELTTALYGYRNDNQIQLVSKEVMLRIHKVESPDKADALALTFAYPVQKKADGSHGGGPNAVGGRHGNFASTEYDAFA